MKNILPVLALLALCGACHFATAQKVVEKQFDYKNKERVVLNLQIADSINIRTWTKNEVYVKTVIEINDNKDNDLYKLTFGDSENMVEVIGRLDERTARRSWGDSSYCCNRVKVYSEVFMPEHANLSVESINANITIMGSTGSLRAKSISGFIDLSMDAGRKADFNMNTVTGTVYSNLDFNAEGSRRALGTKVRQQLNGGGDPISLETISGNIYIRRAE